MARQLPSDCKCKASEQSITRILNTLHNNWRHIGTCQQTETRTYTSSDAVHSAAVYSHFLYYCISCVGYVGSLLFDVVAPDSILTSCFSCWIAIILTISRLITILGSKVDIIIANKLFPET